MAVLLGFLALLLLVICLGSAGKMGEWLQASVAAELALAPNFLWVSYMAPSLCPSGPRTVTSPTDTNPHLLLIP